MVTTTGAHPKKLWPGVKKFFGDTYNQKPLVCERVFKKTTSKKAYEEYVEETGYGFAPIKPESASIQYDTDGQGYVARLTNVVYALGSIVTEEAIKDDQYDSVAKKKAGKLARSMRLTKETVHANILNRAFNAAHVGGDGVELCATNHPTMDGTQGNELAVAADLSEAAVEALLNQIKKATDSRGLQIEVDGESLVVPTDLRFTAHRILNSDLRVGTDHNDTNAMKNMGMLPGGIIDWSYLTDPDAWFIVTDVDDGLLSQMREAYSFAQDNDFDTSNARMKAKERYATGWADWRGLYGSPGA